MVVHEKPEAAFDEDGRQKVAKKLPGNVGRGAVEDTEEEGDAAVQRKPTESRRSSPENGLGGGVSPY